MGTSPLFREKARAKVNMTLRIPGLRADGYHEVVSLIAFAEQAADHLTLDPRGPDELRTTGPFAAAIVGENLIERACRELKGAEPHLRIGSIVIEKSLPVAAGLGGGSSDAAALLRAVREANPEYAASVEWEAIAARLGADVPVCLINQPAWVTGFGERAEAVSGLPGLGAVLANPMVPVPHDKTKQVFRALSAATLPVGYLAPDRPSLQSEEALLAVLRNDGNDLQEAASSVVPEVGRVLASIAGTPGCLHSALSGAGPTAFGIFEDPRAAAQHLSTLHPDWWIAATEL